MFGAPRGAVACGGHHGVDSLTVARASPWNGRFGCSGTVRPPPSLGLDVSGLDDRPPLFDFGFLQRAKGLGRLLLARETFLTKIGEPRTHRRVGQGINNRSIELGDDGHRRTLGYPKCLPSRHV